MINILVQVSCCYFVNGFIVNLKIVIGRLVIGCIMFVFQNWLESVVNSSGVVLLVIWVIVSRILVMILDIDVFSVIVEIIFYFGVFSV